MSTIVSAAVVGVGLKQSGAERTIIASQRRRRSARLAETPRCAKPLARDDKSNLLLVAGGFRELHHHEADRFGGGVG